MSLYPGMKIVTKTGKTAKILDVQGQHLKVKTEKGKKPYYVWDFDVKVKK